MLSLLDQLINLQGVGGVLIKISIGLFFLFLLAIILRKLDPRWCVFLTRAGFILTVLIIGVHFWAPDWSVPIHIVPASWQSYLVPASGNIESATPEGSGDTSVGPFILLFALWAAGTLISLGRELIGFLSISHQGNRSGIASNRLQKLWDSVSQDYGVSQTTIRVANTEQSPFIVFSSGGVLVVVPQSFESTQPKCIERVCHAMRHEAAHIRSNDHIWVPILRIAMCFLWFHPLVWWLVADHLRACEEACDAEAARVGGVDQYRRAVATLALELVPVNQAIATSFIRLPNINDRLKRLAVSVPLRPPRYTAVIPLIALLSTLSGGLGLLQVMGTEVGSRAVITHHQTAPPTQENAHNERAERYQLLDISDVKIEIYPQVTSANQLTPDQRELLKSKYKSFEGKTRMQDLGISEDMIIDAAKAKLRILEQKANAQGE